MSHLTDDDLVLHYYSEDADRTMASERHLQSCAQCARAYASLTRTLRAITPPELVDPPADTLELRELLRAQVRGPASPAATLAWWQGDGAALLLAWLVPVLYPFSLPALFASVHSTRAPFPAIALTVAVLLWACAGPLVAVLVLQHVGDRFDRVSTRLRVLGAIVATISPPLFMLVARGGQSLTAWYEALGVTAMLALLPWPDMAGPSGRARSVHRLSATLLGVFVLGHVINQSLAFVSVPSYAAMRGVMRVASQQSISYAVIVTAVAMQMATGVSMGLKKVRPGAAVRNVQAVSGWYLAVFLLSHVFAGFLLSRPANVPPVAASLTPPYLLGSGTAVAQLPYYLLGVAAFLLHVGVYARLAVLGRFSEMTVRRLSYAAAFAGAMVMVTVGLSLCGIHILQ